MRKAEVYYKDVLAGILTETDDGEYQFRYGEDYCHNHSDWFLTFSMPVNPTVYTDKRLPAFFDGLIPEGWLLDIAAQSWKINKNDRMGLLLACCSNCIGAVSIQPMEVKNA